MVGEFSCTSDIIIIISIIAVVFVTINSIYISLQSVISEQIIVVGGEWR